MALYKSQLFSLLYMEKQRTTPLSETMDKLDLTNLTIIPENFKEKLEGELTLREFTEILKIGRITKVQDQTDFRHNIIEPFGTH